LQFATAGVNKSNFDGDIEAISLALQQLFKQFLPTVNQNQGKQMT